jgi:hypothetical protein
LDASGRRKVAGFLDSSLYNTEIGEIRMLREDVGPSRRPTGKNPVIRVTTSNLMRRYDGQPYGPSTHEAAISSELAGMGTPNVVRRWSMTIVPVMWSVWIIAVAFFAAVYLYRTSLTKDEEDQIFLDDSFEHERTAQAAIVAKVNKIQPMVVVAKWAVAVCTVFVIGYYIFDIYNKLR